MKVVNEVKELQFTFKDLIFAFTEPYNDEEERKILFEYDSDDDHKWVVVEGYHCSCYGFDSVKWEVMAYTREELLKLAALDNNKDDIFWQQILKDRF